MKTQRILLLVVLWLSGGMFFNGCQHDEFHGESFTMSGEGFIPEGEALMGSASLVVNNQSSCIDPNNPEYQKAGQQVTAQWGNPKSPFIKTVDIAYYNTLTHFVLKVKSTHGWADLVINEESVWVDGPVSEDVWGEYSVELPEQWKAGDAYSFNLQVTGYGPPAYFDVEYQLIGECVYYTLGLAVSPEGAGTVTGAGEYMEGEEVALTATANEGWEFVNWTDVNNTEISGLAGFTYTIPAYDVMLTANFEEEEPDITCGYITFTYRGQEVTYGTVLSNGRCWLDRNLGASQVATSSTDAASYGDLFQWGRLDDGHQDRNSPTTTTLSSSDVPGHGSFILALDYPADWRSPQNDNLWQGVNGVNNPCPPGYRLPTEAELTAERESWSSNNSAGAFASPLKLPVAGLRYSNGSLYTAGSFGFYWSSTVDGTASRSLIFYSTGAGMGYYGRASGRSVRCIKD